MTRLLDLVMPRLGPMSIRHVTPVVRPRDAYLRRVYSAMAADLVAGAPPFIAHAAVPDVCAGLWLAAREVWLAGPAPRAEREAIAAGVSRGNECPFCVEIHTTALRGGGHRDAADFALSDGAEDDVGGLASYVAWGVATTAAGSPLLGRPPFEVGLRPQMVGTAFLFHYLNRIANTLLRDSPFPAGVQRLGRPAQKLGDRVLGAEVANTMLRPGEHLDLLPPADLPDNLAWAAPNPHVQAAVARFAKAVGGAAAVLPDALRDLVTTRVKAWHGETGSLSRSWATEAAAELAPDQRPAATLALVVAMAPHQVDDSLVENARHRLGTDAALVAALSWAAFTGAAHVIARLP